MTTKRKGNRVASWWSETKSWQKIWLETDVTMLWPMDSGFLMSTSVKQKVHRKIRRLLRCQVTTNNRLDGENFDREPCLLHTKRVDYNFQMIKHKMFTSMKVMIFVLCFWSRAIAHNLEQSCRQFLPCRRFQSYKFDLDFKEPWDGLGNGAEVLSWRGAWKL